MWKKEYKRYLFSYRTVLIIIFMSAVTVIGLYMYSMTEKEITGQFVPGAEGINMALADRISDSFNFFSYYFSIYGFSDISQLGCLLFFLWLGIFVTYEAYKNRVSGYGNFLISRYGYYRYMMDLFRAQSLYIATVLAVITLIQVVASVVFGGTENLYYDTGTAYISPGECVLIMVAQYFVFVFFASCISIVSTTVSVFVEKGYIMQLLPAGVFVIVPFFFASTAGNILNISPHLIHIIIPFWYIFNVSSNIGDNSDLINLIVQLASIILFASAVITCVKHIKSEKGNDYI